MTEEQIDLTVKRLSKESTAPDKETPNWLEADIRRGIMAGLSLATTEIESLKKENERLRELVERAHFNGYQDGNYQGAGKYSGTESFIIFKQINNLP